MAHTCSECCSLELDHDTKDGKYWCSKKKEYKYADEQECWGYCTDGNRSDSVAESARRYSQDSRRSTTACFITTALCNILNMLDDNIYLNTLRGFRNNYLQKNSTGSKILVNYDVIGPRICESLDNDNDRLIKASILFSNYIVPAVNAIMNNEYDKAIQIYTDMTNGLIQFYEIDDSINVNIEDVDMTKAGHGRVYLKSSMA